MCQKLKSVVYSFYISGSVDDNRRHIAFGDVLKQFYDSWFARIDDVSDAELLLTKPEAPVVDVDGDHFASRDFCKFDRSQTNGSCAYHDNRFSLFDISTPDSVGSNGQWLNQRHFINGKAMRVE